MSKFFGLVKMTFGLEDVGYSLPTSCKIYFLCTQIQPKLSWFSGDNKIRKVLRDVADPVAPS